MLVTCPECSTRYSLDAEALGPSGRQVRCAACGHTWFVQAQDGAQEPVAEANEEAGEETGEEAVQDAAEAASDDATPKTDPEADSEAAAEPAPKPPHRAWRDQRQAQARRRRRLIAMAAWSAVALGLVLTGAVAVINRVAVVRAMPRTASLFKAIGLPANRWGVDLKALHSTRTMENGVPVLHISGEVFNPGKKPRPAPMVRISLRDDSGRELQAWTVPVKAREIPPKSSVAFKAEIRDVPPQAVSIRYAPASTAAGKQARATEH